MVTKVVHGKPTDLTSLPAQPAFALSGFPHDPTAPVIPCTAQSIHSLTQLTQEWA